MKNLVILGAGTGGTLLANRMSRRLSREWSVKVVDGEELHLYQPALLTLPFGKERESTLRRRRARTLVHGVEWVRSAVLAVDAPARQVRLANGEVLVYDYLVVASGCRIRPDLTPGLTDEGWRRDAFDFYTLEGATALRDRLANFDAGRLVVNIVEMPIKCPVAPLEFLFLADEFFRKRGVRDRVELVLATPLDGAFTKPIASRALGYLLDKKGIRVEADFSTGEVDGKRRVVKSYDDREVPYDLLVSIPTHSGAEFIQASGLGNELAFVPTELHTLAAKKLENVFVLGDATDLPTSKAGSVAHFQGHVLAENLMRAMAGRELLGDFDGHANCFIETGFGKALLIDFNYEVEPLPGRYPLAGVGPFSLLSESRINHWGKRFFKWLYWNLLLPARPMPVPNQMSMAGKRAPLLLKPA